MFATLFDHEQLLLHDEGEERWLRAPLADAMELLAPYPAQLMRVDG